LCNGAPNGIATSNICGYLHFSAASRLAGIVAILLHSHAVNAGVILFVQNIFNLIYLLLKKAQTKKQQK
jgi:hypothetical protein